jgi:hypothetical protein
LARQPVAVAQIVYGFLGIPFTDVIKAKAAAIAARQSYDDNIDPSRLLIDATSWPQDVVDACSNLMMKGYM